MAMRKARRAPPADADMPVKRIRSGSEYEPKVGYCRAVVADGWVFVSGSTGVDHATGKISEGATGQCRIALGTIERALTEAGAAFADVVRVRYILPDRADFEPCWPLLSAAFGGHPPAATMIEAGLIDPAMKIEIEVDEKLP